MARIRLAWTPWPSWTRECWLSRIHGMSRQTASSRIACVDGPNAVRSARRMNASSSAVPVELRVGLDEVVDQSYGELGRRRGRPARRRSRRSRCRRPGWPLTARVLPRRMSWPTTCCSASAPCSATWPSQVPSWSRSTNPPRRPREQECSRRPGQHLQQVVGEAGQRVGRELLQRAEVDDEVDRLVVGPDVGAAVDAGLEDREVGRGAFGHGRSVLVVVVLGSGRGASCGERASRRRSDAWGRRRRPRCRGPAGAGRCRPRRARRPRRGRRACAAGPGCAWSGRTPRPRAARAARRRWPAAGVERLAS